MAAGIPTLQTLKLQIDAPQVDDLRIQHNKFSRYDHLFGPLAWQEALIYAWERLEPVETELRVFLNRLVEVGRLVGKNTDFVVLHILNGLPSRKPDEAKAFHIIRPGTEAMLRVMVVQAVMLRLNRQQSRFMFCRELSIWLHEGVRDVLIA